MISIQFRPGSLMTRRTREFSTGSSCREHTPARSADRHLPEAHCRSASILSPAVTATGTTFWAAWIRGTSRRLASRQHDLISAPVQLVPSGRKQFPVGMERSGGCRALLWGEGLTDAQPREGEANGGHRGAEPLGGVGGSLRGGIGGGLGCGPSDCVLAGCGFGGGCCGHRYVRSP